MLPGARSAVQFVEAGGPSKQLVSKMLDPTNRPGLIVDALILLSMLARISRDYYPHLLRADLFPPTLKLLRTSREASVRARVCNLVGNLCRYSDFFFQALLDSGILQEVAACAADEEATTRKFACFALGNAAFHSAALFPLLTPPPPPPSADGSGCRVVACAADEDATTRKFACLALGNAAFHSAASDP
ncbi:armadillo-type protein [Baffinella frigidus]|nr:armadillo-type protein [Cryptophyta sp. CCMP2293]